MSKSELREVAIQMILAKVREGHTIDEAVVILAAPAPDAQGKRE